MACATTSAETTSVAGDRFHPPHVVAPHGWNGGHTIALGQPAGVGSGPGAFSLCSNAVSGESRVGSPRWNP